ncbi:MAG: RagB/SusD family nutrient uptake outer membrane protein [Saprospiraceae bacterium]|nr:RagB/SusD family nutrient uptake outer membrane protein [Saprospiraceae bacterium]MCB0574018.1 RagB/SusD family nutrient uptake outer membrane protein [Saprospiraceae bacterium]MCB9305555.1 RagB/SusD family nutrient uptake outer membrane protein [Lewinellaceae bacterium]MCB9355049.1 RagB/SusD family nutrient uptake outer membrane protein [Lewinellaceae bacterium]
MKKFPILGKLLLPALFLMTFNNSCTNLDEQLFDTVTSENFLRTEEEFIAALGAAYTGLYQLGNHGAYFSVQECSSDETMIPQRGGDWGDGGQWINAHRHESKPTDPNINNAWNFLYSGVNTCNRLIAQFTTLKDAGSVDAALADKFIAELRVLRAMYYYWLMDTFGNVPLVTRFDVPEGFQPATEPRINIFNFVEQELNEAVPLLDKKADGTTYGRMNYYAGKMLQAKLYLNAGVYSGTARWADCVTACNEIIGSNLYFLESTYRNNFITNNSGSKEFIFAVPFDEVFAQGFNLAQMTLHYGSQATYNLQEQPWNGWCSLQDFYEMHDDADARKNNFIVGPQFASDGVTPILDAGAESNDPDGPQVNFTPAINEHFPDALRQAGARIGKYEFKTGATQSLSNDMPIFRYADVLLMKAEALYRQNASDADALDLVNQVRNRSYEPDSPLGALTDADLLAERGREMFYEGVRRQDLIRFGVYGNATEFMPGSDPCKELWPIPTAQRNVNPNLAQNPCY